MEEFINAWETTCNPCAQCDSNDRWSRSPHGENILGKNNMVDRWVCGNCGFATERDPTGADGRHMSELPRTYLRREPIDVDGVMYFVIKGERAYPAEDVYQLYIIQGGRTVYPQCFDCDSKDSVAVPSNLRGIVQTAAGNALIAVQGLRTCAYLTRYLRELSSRYEGVSDVLFLFQADCGICRNGHNRGRLRVPVPAHILRQVPRAQRLRAGSVHLKHCRLLRGCVEGTSKL